ncbi:MAG: Stp1/IreP family PP2C-type Ser/Thr phosphatase [Bryobacterales bacterium]
MSHVGMVRSNNEDSFATVPELGLFLVADGMGGAKAGEKASRIAVETVVAEMRKAGPGATPEMLAEAVQLANHNIRWEAEQNPQDSGMGTTIVAALVREPVAHIVNVGDSRGYLRTGGELYCITSDHSWVNEVGRGLGLSEEQLRSHPYRNVLTKAVGAEEHIEVSVEEIQLQPGDVVLLCSDGLHGVAGENALFEVLSREASLRRKCEGLITAALDKGAPDNVTAVLVESFDPAEENSTGSDDNASG